MINGGSSKSIFENYLNIFLSNCGPNIADIGTSQRFAKELRPYESLFINKKYLAFGYNPEMNYGIYNCDGHANIEELPFEDNSLDGIICIEVLEHVSNPFKASSEIFRVLKKGGKLLLTTPFMLGYHGKSKINSSETNYSHNAYPDYFRFTHEGLYFIFKSFSETKVVSLNGPIETILTIMNLSTLLRNNLFLTLINIFDKKNNIRQTTRHLLYAEK